jgi:cell division protein FtsA
VVEPRYEEFFELAREELQRSGFENLIAAGVVLTGGSSRMEGVAELAEEVFHMPVRLGLPQDVTGLEDVVCNPVYSTAVGLLLFGHENRPVKPEPVLRGGHKGVWARMKSWF